MEDTPIIWGEPPEEYFFEESEPYATIICNTKEDYDDLEKAIEYYHGNGTWYPIPTGYICKCGGFALTKTRFCPHCGLRMKYLSIE